MAAQFTIWWPNRLEAAREGRIETAPTVADFLGTLTPWLTTIGIIALAVGGSPWWVGVGLIFAGIALTKVVGFGAHAPSTTGADST